MKINRKKGYFSISAVSKMFSVHQQTIRLYEKEGLISPKRTSGNTRMFSEEDVNRLEEVIYLTHQLGINLAGVQMILKLEKQIKKMQKNHTSFIIEWSFYVLRFIFWRNSWIGTMSWYSLAYELYCLFLLRQNCIENVQCQTIR